MSDNYQHFNNEIIITLYYKLVIAAVQNYFFNFVYYKISFKIVDKINFINNKNNLIIAAKYIEM